VKLELEAAFPYLQRLIGFAIQCSSLRILIQKALNSHSPEDLAIIKHSVIEEVRYE